MSRNSNVKPNHRNAATSHSKGPRATDEVSPDDPIGVKATDPSQPPTTAPVEGDPPVPPTPSSTTAP